MSGPDAAAVHSAPRQRAATPVEAAVPTALPVWLRLLQHPVAIALALFAVILPSCLPAGLVENTLETLIYARHWLQPDFIANDWRLDMHPGPRLPFVLIVGPFLKLLSIEQLHVAGTAAGFLLLAAALGVLFARLGLSALEAVVVVALFLFANQSLAAGESIFSALESKTFAYALVFGALALTMRGRIVAAAVVLGLAATMNILIGGWAAFCLALALTRRITVRQYALAAAAFAIGALPGVAATLAATPGEAAAFPAGVTAEYIYVYVRAPHHLSPRNFVSYALRAPIHYHVILALAVCAAAAFICLPRFVSRADPRLLISRFLLASLVPVIAGGVAALVPGGEAYLRYYPFRLAAGLFPLLGTAVGLALVVPYLSRSRLGTAVRAAAAIAAVGALLIFDPGARARNAVERPPAGFAEAAAFVRDVAPRGEPVLVSPFIALAGYWMERPVVALWKFVPHDGPGLAEWYERMVDLRVLDPPDSTWQRVRRHYGSGFAGMSAEEYVGLSEKYSARYLVTTRRDDLGLTAVFNGETYAVYDLRRTDR
jgi:hypothetical protein